MGIDLRAVWAEQDRERKKCQVCGESVPCGSLIPIMNPNVFPSNDWDNPEHVWHVCPECKGFIEASMMQSYEMTFAKLREDVKIER